MRSNDRKAWWARNERLNVARTIRLGDEVIDADGHKGIVVKIEPGGDTGEDHGSVYVWQAERTGYGDDNCEHYAFTTWKQHLRMIDRTADEA